MDKVILKKEYSENLYIQYDCNYIYESMGMNSDDARYKFEKYIEKVQEGEIYLLITTEKGIDMVLSQGGSLCISFEKDESINFDNYLYLLEQQNAISYIIEIGDSVILNAIKKEKMEYLRDYCYDIYLKKFKKEPHNIYLKLSSEGSENILTNHKPEQDIMNYFYCLEYKPKFIEDKIKELKDFFNKEKIELDFDFLEDKMLKMDTESFFEKINDNQVQEHEEEREEDDEEEDEEELDEETLEEYKYYETLFENLGMDE